MRDFDSGVAVARRRRRRHPSLLQTTNGVEEIVPGLSSWTAEDLVEAGAWDEELAGLTGFQEEYEEEDERDS